MRAFQKNITILLLETDDDRTNMFIAPIMRRNLYLHHVQGVMGTNVMTTNRVGVGDGIAAAPTTPPPACGLWAVVLEKVGAGTEGAMPVFVFAILQDRLATWTFP
jgi:hypothetical protein